MADTVQYAQPHPEERSEKHEHSDVRVRPLLWIGVGFIVFAVLVHIGLYLLFFAFEKSAAQQNLAPQTALTPLAPRVPEGVPVLQGVPPLHANTAAQDWLKMKAENLQAINSYGRTEHGTARLPIERAMNLALERGAYQSVAPAAQPNQRQNQPTPQRPATATPSPAKGGHDAPAPH